MPHGPAFTGAWAWRQPGEPGPGGEITPSEADGQVNNKNRDDRTTGGRSRITSDRKPSGNRGGNGLAPKPPRPWSPHDMIIAQAAASRQRHRTALPANALYAARRSPLARCSSARICFGQEFFPQSYLADPRSD